MKTLQQVALILIVLLVVASPALAAPDDTTAAHGLSSVVLSGSGFGAGLGAALTIVGAGIGFGRIGAAALESMARQPEVAGQVQTAMIVIGALLEGVTLFALIVCIVVANKATF